MIERLNAGGIDCFHLFDQRENAIQFVERGGGLGLGDFELRQLGEAFYIR